MAQTARIPRDIVHFVPYMDDTDTYQLSIDPSTGNPRWQNWGWTAADSAAWTGFRNKADTLFAKYNNKKFREGDVTEKLHLLITGVGGVVEYDQKEKLLDSIAATPIPPADIADFEHFHVKKGTVIADATPTRVADGMGEPAIVMKKTEHLSHTLGITNPAHKGKGKGKHIKEVQVWRAIMASATATAPAAIPTDDDYKYVGEAKRGSYKSEFATADVGKTCWHKARYKNTQGKFGDFCKAIDAPIV
ncbi:MAG: hypothetical protein HY063_08105 [Bacteroidetes bacterium]|nr:hypothetical protein [Bacteroidota bacterium]